MKIEDQVEIRKSNGYGKGGASVYYIRPRIECVNRSRRVKGFTYQELETKIEKLIAKWYAPLVITYKVDGVIIGSSSKENALKEYWRICELQDVGKMFNVEQVNNSLK